MKLSNFSEQVARFKKTIIFLVVFGLVIVTAVAVYGAGYRHGVKITGQAIAKVHSVREDNQTYHFIYPLLLYDFSSVRQFLEDQSLHQKLEHYIADQYKLGDARSISVVVRNFPDGSRVNVNETTQYHPGSMLKVLIMMAYFREAELAPTMLEKTLSYSNHTHDEITSIQFSQPTSLVVGQSYPIQQLIEAMIKDSDNGAEQLLLDNVDVKILDQAYVDLGVPSPDSVSGDYTISAGQYAGFLRILYNSTYLTEQYSEKALFIMSESSYKDGIVAGVPAGTTVSHKYGERVDTDGSGNVTAVELHDCGIMYLPSHPYELCVMTKGGDEKKLAVVLKDISNLVYKQVTGN